jgi:hypothetical protein
MTSSCLCISPFRNEELRLNIATSAASLSSEIPVSFTYSVDELNIKLVRTSIGGEESTPVVIFVKDFSQSESSTRTSESSSSAEAESGILFWSVGTFAFGRKVSDQIRRGSLHEAKGTMKEYSRVRTSHII